MEGREKWAQECPPLAHRRQGNGSNLKGHIAVAQGPVATCSSHRGLTRSAASNSICQILVTGCRAAAMATSVKRTDCLIRRSGRRGPLGLRHCEVVERVAQRRTLLPGIIEFRVMPKNTLLVEGDAS